MGLLGSIGNKVGEIFSKNQEAAANKKAENAEAREASEAAKESVRAKVQEIKDKYNQDDISIFEQFSEMTNLAQEVIEVFQEDTRVDIYTTISDIAADVGAAVKSFDESSAVIGQEAATRIINFFGNLFAGDTEK